MERTGGGRLQGGAQCGATRRIGDGRSAGGLVEPHHRGDLRHGFDEGGHPELQEVGERQSDHLRAPLGREVTRFELLAVDVRGGHGTEQVPVERAIGGQRHVGHELHAVPRHLADPGDHAQGRAGVEADHPGQGHTLHERRRPGRDRHTVAVGVDVVRAGRQAERAGGERLGEQTLHGGEVYLARVVPRGGRAHDGPSQRRVAHQEAGVDAEPTFEPVEERAEGRPVDRAPGPEGAERDALDDGHHARHVVGISVGDRGQRESAVPGDDRGDAVERRRAGVRVPEELGVVVGVDVDETGGHHQSVGIENLYPGGHGGRSIRTDHCDATVHDRHIGGASRRAGTVDDGRTTDQRVGHGRQSGTGLNAAARTAPGPRR